MNLFVNGRCFWCNCKQFRCPSCGELARLTGVDDAMHEGLCDACGPVDDYCDVRATPRENIFGA